MSSGRFAEVRTPLMLSILMVLMTQVGYLDLMNAWSGHEETLDDAEPVVAYSPSTSVMYGIHTSSGVAVQNLTASAEGAELLVGEAMTNITFQYDASAANGSGSNGSGSSSSTSSFAYANNQVASGGSHTCAILDNGSVSCWGRGNLGQLGNGGTSDKTTPTLTSSLGTGRTAVALSSGTYHTCAILDNGSVSCWGWGLYGRLGNGGTTDKTTPTLTSSLGTGRTAVALSSGGAHTCAILDNGAVSCWGAGGYGQLGNGGTSRQNTPTLTSSLGTGRTAVALSSGFAHTCAILDNGDVSCWGRGNNGRLGNGGTSDKSTPTLTSSLGTGRTAVALSSGDSHTCAILDNGSVSCWGYGYYGRLGNGGTSSKNTPTLTSSLGTGRTAVALSSGEYHTCAILDDGAVSCWGAGSLGQLGNGGTTDKTTPTLTSSLGTGRTAVALSSGAHHTCAILDNGAMSCWGAGGYGRLGNGGYGSNGLQYTPASVSGSNTWDSSTGLSSGSGGGMTNVTGALSCSVSPALPTGLSIDSSTCTISGTPTVETSNTTYTVTANISNVTYQGSVWLSSSYPELTPSVEGADLTVDVPMTNITFQYDASAASGSGSGSGSGSSSTSAFAYANNQVASGDTHTCAILDNGDLKCWGQDNSGQLGDGGSNTNTKAPSSNPINLGTGRTAVAVSAGTHTCAILDNGSVSCWGNGLYGRLGNGGTSMKTTPTLTSSLGTGRTAVALSSGFHHTCAILDNGAVSCWGRGNDGQLGNGGTTDKTTPTLTSSLGTGRTAVALSSGDYHTCAILDNGAVSCWGRGNNGQLGNGGTSQQNSPTLTSSLGTGRTAVALSSGGRHTCAILDNGAVSCWGTGAQGQLGNGGTSNKNTPTLTSSLGTGRTAVALSSGHLHTCTILDNGDVSCWGKGGYGRLGNGGTSDKSTPTLTSSLGTGRTAVALSSGGSHTCAILDNGSAMCWGNDGHGKLGDGDPSTDQTSPVLVSGSNTWDSSTGLSSPITNVTGALSCSVSPALPTGLSIDSSTCTISGTPAVETSNTTYTVTANISNVTYQITVWLSSSYLELTPSAEGADLIIDEAMTNITFQYDASAASGSDSGSGSGSVTSSLAAQNMAGGRFHTCAIVDDGSVACWGDNTYGQLGDGTNNDRSTPTLTDSLGVGRTAVQVATGDYFTCVMLDNDEVKCWGDNAYGQLGDGTTTDKTSPPSSAITFPTGLTPVALVAGDHQACAIMDDESLTCWGRNEYGELGDGTTTNRNTPTAVSLNAGENVIDVGSGDYHTCALLDDGSIKCWGKNNNGQLGDGTTTNRNTPVLTDSLGTGRTAVDIGVSEFATCALLDNDDVKCWGRNHKGQLGDGTTTDKNSPPSSAITFPTGRTPVAISDSGAGLYHACALLDDGNVSCWGGNSYGQLGDSTTTTYRNTPGLTDSLGTGRTAVHVTTGLYHTCALLDNGDITCWGHNSDGQLGIGTITDRSSPTAVSTSYSFDTSRVMGSGSGSGSSSSMTNVTGALSCSVSPALPTGLSIDSSTCTISGTPAVETSNTTYTVTANISNVTYQGSVWLSSSYPELTPSAEGADLIIDEAMTNITFQYNASASSGSGSGSSSTSSFAYANNQISSAGDHTCAILDNGAVSCWGSGSYGQLGNGGTSTKTTPTLTSSLGTGRTAVALSSGILHTCAILDNGAVSCWGRGSNGQLGNGGTSHQNTPTLTSSLGTGRTAVALSSGYYHTCAILDNGAVSCWGRGAQGQLGDGGTSNKNTPTPTSSLGTGRTAVALSSGGFHTCAILDNGAVSCWGSGSYGQLGDGGLSYKATPTLTSSLGTDRTAVALSSGSYHTCAILDNGAVSCWGAGGQGQLGNGGTSNKNTPTLTSSLGTGRTAVALSSGEAHTCAILDNGAVSCWGYGLYGRLGNGATSDKSTPTLTSSLGTGRTAVALSSGDSHTCVILDNGDAKCWGDDSAGQLGDGGSNTGQTSPVLVAGSNTWDSSTGLSGGSGSGSSGGMTGMTNVTGATCSVSPALPTGLSIDSSTCTISGTPAVETSNTTYTVTANISNVTYQGSVWLSTSTFGTITSAVEGAALNLGEAMTPITLNYTVNANASTGSTSSTSSFAYANNKLDVGDHHTCAIVDNGDLKCWGEGDNGRLGQGNLHNAADIQAPSSTAIDLGTGRTAVAVSAGGSHTCAILDNGSVSCWGEGGYGRLGNGGTSDKSTPTLTSSLGTGRTAVAVSAGAYHSCALLNDGGVMCWGMYEGSGKGFSSNYYWTTPYQVTTGYNSSGAYWYQPAIAISAGGAHSCVILDDGLVRCWGLGTSGQLGLPNIPSSPKAANSLGGSQPDLGTGRTAIAISAGYAHTCAILDNGDLKCWGSNTYGQLGDGTTTNRNEPTLVSSLGTGRTAVAVSAGWSHTCAILDNGDVKCWGRDHGGQLGDGGSNTDLNAPPSNAIDLGTNRTAVAISSGERFTCAILENGEAKCWGQDAQGQLGDGGSNTDQGSPVSVSGSNSWDTTTTVVTWETHPALPAGMSISAGTISGTPSVYALNQTYTIYANQSGYSTTHELYFSVDTDNAHTVVEHQAIDPIGFHPPFNNGTTAWSVSPALPSNLSINASTGEITGSVNGTLADTAYTVTATHNGSATETFSFNLRSLADYDGDGLPNDLPGDYDAAEGPTSGLVADSDDDGDGLDDSVETGTGNYVDGTDTGTNPLNPDTDGDGVCDGPNAVPGVCVAGPDADPNGAVPPPTLVGVNNTAISTLSPYLAVSGGTYEISPDLPASLTLDANTGEISGTPTEALANTTFTVWANHSDGTSLTWDFTIEILEDSDGDGLPNELPGDYDSSNPDSPGLVEDTDDDADGVLDTDEGDTGTSPTNPDTDGDGMCDGPNAVSGVCSAGPDAFPLDPSADTDTDGDGMPDTIDGDSTSVPPLVEDEDDDGDGLDDVYETDTGTYVDESDTGTDPLDPDTDNDGICDGPNAVPPICVAGPDDTPLGQTAEGTIYALNNSLMVSLTPKYTIPDGTYEIHPALPAGVSIDPVSGIISGTPTEVIPETEYTVYGNATSGGLFFTFNLEVLEDTDRDGLPNELPDDYPGDGELVEDLDDDGDGASDLSETGTGIYNGAGDLGTDSLNPDTDGDGICDGPNAVPPICLAGPDSNPVGTGPLGPTVLVNNTETTPINPPNAVSGATWEVSPDLPEGLVLDPATGIITGTPTEAMDNTTYTIWANTTDPAFSIEATFWLEILEDFDGDGMPDELPDDYPDTGVEPYTLIEDEDDDNDGMSDTNESIIGTNPYNPDTDGDGFCDGDLGVEGVCFAGPDSHPLDPTLPVNTDGDAYPDEDPDGPGGLIADDDDDNDGYLDTTEVTCESDPLDAISIPDDMDGDGICDLMDDDVDGDGIPNEDELGLPIDTSPSNPDSDGDGVCDGPEAPANGGCVAGPDAFPLDPAGAKDTDGDGKPDQLVPGVTSTSQPPLVEDLDDDDDTWSDADELACGTSSPVDAASVPADTDGDGICDALDPYLDLPFTLEYPTQYVDLFVNRTMEPLLPWVNGSGDVVSWELEGELPEGLTFGWSPARDATMDGSIRGTPTNASATVNLTVWANNSVYSESFALSLTVFNDLDNDSIPDQLPEGYVGNLTEDTDDDNDGFSDSQEAECGSDPNNNMSGQESWLAICLSSGGDRPEDGVNWMWCFPCLLLLLLLLIIPLLLGRDRILVMLSDGPEPENTFAEPDFTAGSGTEDDPFILAPVGPLQPGTMESTVEEITITNMGDIRVDMFDFNDEDNYGRFTMYESAFSMEGSRQLPVGKDGEMVINFKFDDREFPTYEGGTYTGRIKLGKASVYFLWEVTVMADDRKAEDVKKQTMSRIKKRKKDFNFDRIGKATKKDADDLQAIKGIGPYSEEKLNALGIFTYEQLAHFDRETEDEVNDAIEHYKGRIRRDEWVKQAQDIIGAQAKADEEALKAAEEAQAKAEAEAKAAEEAEAAAKAAEEAEAAKKAEEEAAAAAAAAEKEAKEAEKKAKEEAAAKEAEKKAKAEADKKAKAAEEKAAKEAEKKAKAEADKKAKEEAAAAAAAKKAEEEAAAAAAAKKAEEEAKKAKAAEEKAAKEAEKKAKAEADKKAKEEAAAKKKAKPASKEVKKQEELERVKSRAKSIDFKVLGEATSSKLKTEVKKGATSLEVADASQFADAGSAALTDKDGTSVISWTGKDGNALTGVSGITRVFGKASIVTTKDDLQVIKGIGPFIEEKLNALGITTYRQIANMNAKLEEQVNKAIEFFPGRVKRDQWANQAKILLGEDVKLDEKALKQAEELERVAAKAEKIDFATLGVASASEKDDLKSIKGIGPFIEEKLNALGIYTFEQVSKMTAKIEEEVNVAIEFFPGRVKRDEWAKQAKKLHKDKK